ncbi:MAG: ribose 5-phosphate isomerase B [Clostridium sp.]|nr:ribose 5-phosphate isomerase B [Clostridium sp.]
MIAIGCDHGGYKLKKEIEKYLDEKNIDYKDFGSHSEERVDYPDIAKEVAVSIQKRECDTGILICRSGIGMSIVANKFKGIRCTPCYNETTAKYARMHNNGNILSLGADNITVNDAICILRTWIATEYEGGRHDVRLKMIEEIENENMK